MSGETLEQTQDGNTALRYGTVTPNKRRKLPTNKITSESIQMPRKDRTQAQSNAQQQVRDLSMLAWMVRRHLDYVSGFRLQFKTGEEELDKAIGEYFSWHAAPRHFDVAASKGREEMFRLFEQEKTTGGDAGMLKINKMLSLQAVESDLIAFPKDGKEKANGRGSNKVPKNVADSVHKNDGCTYSSQYPGRVEQWCICSRGSNGTGLHYAQLVPRESMIFGRYLSRFGSQTRGVSPLTACLNSCSDMYQGIDLQLAKARIHALFGIAIFRDYSGGDFEDEAGAGAGEEDDTANTDGTSSTTGAPEFVPNQMTMMDMDVNGRADMLESTTPSNEFREFIETVARIVLLALDIPYSAWNSGESSFSAIMADQNQYEVSCKFKRRQNEWSRRDYSDWAIEELYDKNEMVPEEFRNIPALAEAAGMTMRQVQAKLEWIPSGFPWLQKMQEISGDILAISAGLDNPYAAARRRGGDYDENIRLIRQAIETAGEDVPLVFANSGGIRSVQETIEAANKVNEANDDQ
jgi:hypothetical protein